jgi:peptidyl-prolyl cis-trans isomerase C
MPIGMTPAARQEGLRDLAVPTAITRRLGAGPRHGQPLIAWAVGACLLAAAPRNAGLAQSAPPASEQKLPPEAALTQLADQFDKTPNTVVAEVGGTPITLAMVADQVRALPPIWGTATAKLILDYAVSNLIQTRVLVEKAKQLGLDKDPKIQRRIVVASDDALASAVLQNAAAGKVTPAAIKELYDRDYAGKPGPEEAWIRLIGTPTEAEARDALQKIHDGMDFASAVQTFSRDPSKDAGGDLGYVTVDKLPAPLAAVAFAMSPGQISGAPVQSGNMWYILEVEARRQRGAYSLQEATPTLRADLTRAAVLDYLKTLQSNTEIKYYGANGPAGAGLAASPPK